MLHTNTNILITALNQINRYGLVYNTMPPRFLVI